MLKIFHDVVSCQSFSEAATENQVTQAAVSQGVRQLEKRLGVTLIDRTQRPFKLTEAGTFYHENTKEMVDKYFAVENELKSLRGEVGGRVRVAAIYSAGLGEISRTVQQFTKKFEGCSVGLSFLHPDKVYQCVQQGEADLGIISYPRQISELRSVSWRNETLVLAVPGKHPLAKKERLTFSDFYEEAFIAFESGLLIRKEIDRFLRKHGAEPTVVMTFDNVETIKRAVELGEGIAILPEPAISVEVRAGTLAALALPSPGLIRPLSIIYRKDRVFFRAADRFIEMMLKRAAMPGKAKAA